MKYILIVIAYMAMISDVFAHGMSDAARQKFLNAGYKEYIELGASHMVTGYDHLLFLFGVIFFLTRFRDIVKFVTAFTLGHSITLIFATFYGIKANYFLIDAVIALTVCYKGFDNLDGFKKYFRMPSPNLIRIVFMFGLIHGFGLSTRLQLLPLNQENLLWQIIAFNVGVELGQIGALSVMMLVLLRWRKSVSFNNISKVANSGLIIIGFLLFLMQLHGYVHFSFPDKFLMNKDDHYHAHEAMKTSQTPETLKNYKRNPDFQQLYMDKGN